MTATKMTALSARNDCMDALVGRKRAGRQSDARRTIVTSGA